MGNILNQANPTPDGYTYDLNVLNNRIYALAPNFNMYRLNVTEDDWETPLVVPSLPDQNIRSVIFDGKLYIYPLNNSSSQLCRVNDTEDAVIPVCDYPSNGYLMTMGVVNNRLYTSCIQDSYPYSATLLRLNLTGNAWESLVTMSDGFLAHSIVEFNGRLYNFSMYGDIYRLSIDELSFEGVAWAPGISSYGTAIVFNNRLYFPSSYQLYRLSLDETTVELVAEDSTYSNINKTFIYNNRLYMTSDKMLRLNETEDGLENLWNVPPYPYTSNITTTVLNNNRVYFSDDTSYANLLRYSSIFSAFTGTPLVGIAPLGVDFTSTVASDFPITGYSWNFGDTGTSTEANPTHEYTSAGVLDVTLEASNSLDTDTATNYSYVKIIDSTIYYIHNVEELQLVGSGGPGYPVAGKYTLANDIDASGTLTWNAGQGFEPIANFIGVFDGAGYTISDLYINRPYDTIGIFAQCGAVSFYDLTITNAVFWGSAVGLVVCYSNDLVIFNNCHITGVINSSGNYTCGTLVAVSNLGCEVTNCTATITADNCTAGGLIGSVYSYGSFIDCSTDVTYNRATSNFAGFVAWAENTSFENCHAVIDAEVDVFGSNCAGFVGYASDVQATNCSSYGAIKLNYGTSIGTMGGFSAWFSGAATNCTSNVNMSSDGSYVGWVGGFAGNVDGPVTDCHSTGSMDFKCTNNSNYIGGFAAYSGNPITLDINRCSSSGNIALEVIDDSQLDYISSFIGYILSDIIGTCYSTGNLTITGKASFVGGFAGYGSVSSAVSDCFSSGDIFIQGSSEGTNIGGFAGNLFGIFIRCFSLGDVVGSGTVGGFAGEFNGTLSECFSKGNLTCIGTDIRSYVGGFIGDLRGGSIEDCYATGNILNMVENDLRSFGGLIGNASGDSMLRRCYSTGSIIESLPPPVEAYNILASTDEVYSSYGDVAVYSQKKEQGSLDRISGSPGGYYSDFTVTPTNDIIAVFPWQYDANGYESNVYIQYGGVGDFELLTDQFANTEVYPSRVEAAPNGDVYVIDRSVGSLWRQTGGSGSFVEIPRPGLFVRNLCCTPNGNVLVAANSGLYLLIGVSFTNITLPGPLDLPEYLHCSPLNGDIYMMLTYSPDNQWFRIAQTGGAFHNLNFPLSVLPLHFGFGYDGNVYMYTADYSVSQYKFYMLPGGVGDFSNFVEIPHPELPPPFGNDNIVCLPNLDIALSTQYGVYKQTGGTGSFSQISSGVSRYDKVLFNRYYVVPAKIGGLIGYHA
jgi:PKD repeat protein